MLAYLNTPTKFDDPKGPRYTSLFFSFPHNTSFQHLRAFSRVRMSSSKKSHLMKHWNKEVEHEEHWRSCGILLFTMNYKLWSKQLSWQGTSTTISDLRVTLVIHKFCCLKGDFKFHTFHPDLSERYFLWFHLQSECDEYSFLIYLILSINSMNFQAFTLNSEIICQHLLIISLLSWKLQTCMYCTLYSVRRTYSTHSVDFWG